MGIEAIEVAQKDAERVAEAAVRLGDLFEEILAEGNLVLPIDAGDPEPDDVGSVLVVEIGGVGGLAAFSGVGFGELFLVLIHDEAVGHHGLVGRVAAEGGGEHERALEPAAVLIGGLEVEIGGAMQLRMRVQHSGVRAAGIDPDIERVSALFQTGGKAELGGEFVIGSFEPDVRALFLNEIRDLVGELGREDGLVVFVEENGKRNAPCALAGDAPIGARLDGSVDPVAPPGRHPFHFVDLLQCLSAQGFQRDEELLDSTEDDRRFRAPAMRVGVFVFLLTEQVAAFREDLDDATVRFENVHADKLCKADLCREKPFVIDGREHAQAVLLAGDIVVRAVARSDVDGSGSGFRGDEIREDDLRGAVEERVFRLGAFEFLAFDFGEGFS